jgi:sigma-B regulation protein RsbU (phosphoserine phosphatase)
MSCGKCQKDWPARLWKIWRQSESEDSVAQRRKRQHPMTIQLWNTPVSFFVRRSVRYLLISQGFRLLQAIVVLTILTFLLTGSRLALIDQFGNRADIVASIVITVATVSLLMALNRRVMTMIDRRFFREAYNAEVILTQLVETIPKVATTKQLVHVVAESINDALHPENVIVFLDDEPARAYVAAYRLDASQSPVPASQNVPVPYEAPIVAKLLESGLREGLTPSPAEQSINNLRAALLIPIAFNGRLHGFISLGRRLSDLPYAREDRSLLLVVANQIATFTETLKIVSRMAAEERAASELKMAAEVQRHLFPAAGLEDEALSIYGFCLPALGVGGDYYDYFQVEDRHIGIAIADVAGKGISAALLMSTVQASLRCQMSSSAISLPHVATSINHLLQRSTDENRYATIFFAEFDEATRNLTFVNAGHNPPLLVRAGSNGARADVKLLTAGGPIIGTFLDKRYEQETIQLVSGDVLIGYTDGVTEALNDAGEEFGLERLQSVAIESHEMSSPETTDKIVREVLNWQGQAVQHDDITLVVTKVK